MNMEIKRLLHYHLNQDTEIRRNFFKRNCTEIFHYSARSYLPYFRFRSLEIQPEIALPSCAGAIAFPTDLEKRGSLNQIVVAPPENDYAVDG